MCITGKGRVELAIKRLEIVQPSELIFTRDWLDWAFPRRSKAEISYPQYLSLWRAAKKTHVFVRMERDASNRFVRAIWRKRTESDGPAPKPRRWDKPKPK